jgi:putative ABC transport system permease protein
MSLPMGALPIGLILALLALGVYISFRIFHFLDMTADGSITLGASVCALLLGLGWHPAAATLAAPLAGMAAGALTGVLAMKCRINRLLAGILTMTALYSVNLRIMGRSDVSLTHGRTLVSEAEQLGRAILGKASVSLFGWDIGVRDAAVLALAAVLLALICLLLFLFFRTRLGTAMRAAGDNAQMIRALGADDGVMVILGLALSNGLIALSGALLAQFQGFADAQMGVGMVVWGLASVMIGEALVGARRLGFAIAGAVLGSVLFRLLMASALRWGLNPNDLKLITAGFVFAALILPKLLDGFRARRRRLACA